MYHKRMELEPDDKPMEARASIKCGVGKVCKNNLFGYCQIMPNMDGEGKCISRRVNENRN
jgi:hypothetical protein